jgi:predicted lipoprotein with Yx(FWY)xxD motif
MKIAIATIASCATLVFGVAACGDDDSSSAATATTATTTAETASTSEGSQAAAARKRRGKAIKLMNSRYGRMLFDSRGRAIYLFTKEKGSRSRCYGQCAVAWPPVFTRGRPRARSGVDRDLLATTRRRDGRRQVTYNGHPLYYYISDVRSGQVTCQNVVEFGGTWLVVDPAGNAITAPR